MHSKDFLVKGTALAKKKPICAEMKIILKLILSYACLLKKINQYFGHFLPSVITVHFTYFETGY